MTLTTLVTGASAARREATIVAALDANVDVALILEGLPDGGGALEHSPCFSQLHVARIAPGCPCCTGNLTMRVTLNRILRRRPHRLYIGLASSAHLEQVRQFLTQTPYDTLLQLTEDLQA